MWSFLSLVLPIIFTIPIGIAINIITPRVQNWLAARALTRTSKRMKALKKELATAMYYHNNLSKLYIQSAIAAFNYSLRT
jgi:hypothetical protein